ncbi:threonine synthase [Rhodococcus spongiicola]|uniref:Pyridoxal-phosphate dependent enzyme n=1 Tax=Rhodococcus spongiicola TaxID=2487352 RepID=A0A438AUY5_9NOCA|nr:pyridoxal-phosphate dependent enzyme [Rhodococcus spongiicola]RVW02465.1 pyridoxal-phosphate dependent enzyme [Rhodococcus spongiicola]
MPPSTLVGRDGSHYPIDTPRWRAADGSPLLVSPLPGITGGDVDTSVRSQWRYSRALPFAMRPVSLGEGCTPMLDLTVEGITLHVKPEWFNPTGSFKDRGSSVMMSVLAHQGIEEILEDSSGNGGASVAAYAAAAGIHATILAPQSTSEAKLLQSRFHGARVDLVPGDRHATAVEAVRRSGELFYASHNWHPFFLQGTKLLAYEIWEDLGFGVPDAVLLPAGAGSLALGCSIGFDELVRSGAIEKPPRILVVQPQNCSPLVEAFTAGRPEVSREPGRWTPTVAEGTSIAVPVRDREVLDAVRASGGDMVAVPETAIGPAVRRLAARGLYAEPTSAMVIAALPDFLRHGSISESSIVVAILTGSGLKADRSMARLLAETHGDGDHRSV